MGVRRKRRRVDPRVARRMRIRNYYRTWCTPWMASTAFMLSQNLGDNSKQSLDSLWMAILGLTDQHQRQQLADSAYDACCGTLRGLLQAHLDVVEERGRYMVTDVGAGDNGTDLQLSIGGQQSGHIKVEQEYRFFLHRHWSLFDAMSCSPYLAAKMGVWGSSSSSSSSSSRQGGSGQGAERLKDMLAKMGMPLKDCKQTYAYMPPALKDHLWQEITKRSIAEDYRLMGPGVTLNSFSRYNSYRNPVAALDVVMAAQTLVESFALTGAGADGAGAGAGDGAENAVNGGAAAAAAAAAAATNSGGAAVLGCSRHAAFSEAYDCLGAKNELLLKKGVEAALTVQRLIVSRARVMLDGSDAMTKLRNVYWAKVRSSLFSRLLSPPLFCSSLHFPLLCDILSALCLFVFCSVLFVSCRAAR